jgi:hypothetical protein
MPCLDGPTQAVSTQIQHRTAAHTKLETCPAPSGNPSKRLTIPPPSSRDAFCDLPICPTTCSTASADMEQPFGAKPARSFLLLMPWIAANHGIEGAVSVSVDNKNSRSTIPCPLIAIQGFQTPCGISARFASLSQNARSAALIRPSSDGAQIRCAVSSSEVALGAARFRCYPVLLRPLLAPS